MYTSITKGCDMENNKEEVASTSKRRVYELPNELVERIVEFQTARSLPSEVEAVRRLLDMALKSRDTIETLVGRYLNALSTPGIEPGEAAGVVLSGHPLVRQISFEEDSIVFHFQLPNKPLQAVQVVDADRVTISDPSSYGSGDAFVYNEKKTPGSRLTRKALDDEIPF